MLHHHAETIRRADQAHSRPGKRRGYSGQTDAENTKGDPTMNTQQQTTGSLPAAGGMDYRQAIAQVAQLMTDSTARRAYKILEQLLLMDEPEGKHGSGTVSAD